MEIVTTMTKFRCQKKAMTKQTQSAQIFLFDTAEGKVKVFVPKSKLIIKKDATSDKHNLCIMPKWAFNKTKNLAEHVEIIGETQHLDVINDIKD